MLPLLHPLFTLLPISILSGLEILSPFSRFSITRRDVGNPANFRSVIWDRQLDGALNRTPAGFYDKVWAILERTPMGLKVAGYLLPQVLCIMNC